MSTSVAVDLIKCRFKEKIAANSYLMINLDFFLT